MTRSCALAARLLTAVLATVALAGCTAGGAASGSPGGTATAVTAATGTPTPGRAGTAPLGVSPRSTPASQIPARTPSAGPVGPSTSATPSPIPLTQPGEPGLVVGHRGNDAGAPEDTLASEVSAARVGAQVLEFDLHMTADGVPILMHDSTVDRTTNGHGRVSSLTLSQIEKLDAGSSYSAAFAGVRVPTFSQVLKFAASHRNLVILPEFKEAGWSADQVRTVVDLIRTFHMDRRTMFQSFYRSNLRLAHQIAPDIAGAVLVTTAPANPVSYVRSADADGLLPKYTAVTPTLVSTLHRAGISIMVWTVNNPAEWAVLTADGVDGIMSDNPGALSGWIARYRQYRRG